MGTAEISGNFVFELMDARYPNGSIHASGRELGVQDWETR